MTFLQTPMAVSAFAMDDILFTPNVMYRNNGFTVSFLTNLKYLKKDVPDNYGSESVETLTHDFQALPGGHKRGISEYCRDYERIIFRYGGHC